MNHLRSNGHISRSLKNLEVVVIDDWKIWRLGGGGDTTHPARKIEKAVRQSSIDASGCRGSCCFCLCAFGGERDKRRNVTIGWIDNQRCTAIGDPETARIHPVFVVGSSDVRLGAAVPAIAAQFICELLLKISGFLIVQNTFPSDSIRPLEWCTGGIVPDALQIRITPRRTRRRPWLLCWSLSQKRRCRKK